MPIYLYRCDRCSREHEELQKAGDAPLTVCPSCGEAALRKLIAPAGVIFKGSGFHKNDYSTTGRRSSGAGTSGSSGSEGSSAPDAGASSDATGKGDSGPEKKAAATESTVA